MMPIYKPELMNVNNMKNFPMKITHPYHMVPKFEDVLNQGKNLSQLGNTIGAEMTLRSGTFTDTMLNALDQVSSHQQIASEMIQDAIVNPDLYDPHDITIAQSMASMSLNMTRNILNRLVQGWRDIINIR